jgi:hypothetical protein
VLSFVELREKVKLKGGEKEVKSYKAGKKKDKEVVISKKGSKYAVYVDSELLDNDYKNEKEAQNAANDMLKLLGM